METYKEIAIKYYDTEGNIHDRCKAPVLSDALVHYELMQSHYCKLSFKSASPVYLQLGDFIETPYGRFEVIDKNDAKDDDSIGYSYEVQFEAYYRKLKNKILKYRPNSGSSEATFSLTSNINTHANVILGNLEYLASLSKSYLYDPQYSGDKKTDYTVAVDASVDQKAAKVITYSNTSILDAISNIASTFECEWWFEGNILHFGTCENTNAITDFKFNDNIVSMSSSQSQSTYANRVYAFGAARNLPSGYKSDADADITKDGVVETRLMLPSLTECSDKNKQLLEENGFELKSNYIQVKGLVEDLYVEGVTTNDDIYPRNLIKTEKVTSYEKEVEDESTTEEGDYIKRTFYRVNSLSIVNEDGEKTGDMAFRESCILSGKQLHIVFQSGSLNGMDFECEFNPDGKPEIIRDDDGNPILKDGKEQANPEAQVFEIVANEDYGRFLPDTSLHPKNGDTFVLYNWDSTKLGDTLVSSASNELLTDAIKNLKKSMIDPTTYTCTASSRYSFNDGKGMFLGVGDRVNLYNKGYVSTYRESRVIGYELHLDLPFDNIKYYVGEKPSYSRLNAMESKIEELVYNGQSYIGNGSNGSSIYIIKSYDKTLPTEYNVYSAKAVNEQRLSKLTADTAQGIITFVKGLIANGIANLNQGATFGNNGYMFDKDGNVVVDNLYSQAFDEALESGFGITKNTRGKYTLSITDLVVWGKAIFNTLEIRKLYSIGGNVMLSGAQSKLQHVVPVYDEDGVTVKAWKCYIMNNDGTTATQNGWQPYDQAKCQTFDIDAGVYENMGNRYYWRLVTEVSSKNEVITETRKETYTDDDGNQQDRETTMELYDGKAFGWIVMSASDCESEDNDAPAAGDTIVLDGHRMFAEGDSEGRDVYNDESRTNVMMLETTGADTGTYPRIVALTGIVDYRHADADNLYSNTVFILSPKEVVFVSSAIKWISASGDPITFVNFRGPWVEGTSYGYYDQVSHKESIWTCIVEKGKTTTEEPGDGSAVWRKEISGGKGEDGVSYILESSPSSIVLNDDGSINYEQGYTDLTKDNYLVVRGYRVENGARNNQFATSDNPITVRLILNSGHVYYEYTATENDDVNVDFTPEHTDSYGSLFEEMETDGLKNAKAVMFEGDEYDASKVLATLSIPIVKNGKGDDAETYSVILTKGTKTTSSGKQVAIINLSFRHQKGTETTTTSDVRDISGASVKCYVDGVYNTNMTNYINGGSGYLDYSAYESDWEGNSTITVTLLVGDAVVASANFALSQKGETGDPGKSALEVVISPETLVFDTNDNGIVPNGSAKAATITCYRDGVQVTDVGYTLGTITNCTAKGSQLGGAYIVTVSTIDTESVTGTTSTVSKTNGTVDVTITDNATGTSQKAQVKFAVNVAKFTGGLMATNKELRSSYTELSNNLDGLADELVGKMDAFDLTEYRSEILQTARGISLSVSEKAVGRRNLLVGSAARRQGDGWTFMAGDTIYNRLPCNFIEINGGHEGVNAIHCRTKQTGTDAYYLCGLRWTGTVSPQGNVKLERGKSYTLSFWAKAENPSYVNFVSELVWQGSATDYSRPAGYAGPTGFSLAQKVTASDTWTLLKVSITVPSDAAYEYVEVCLFARATGYTLQNAYICKPMLEEGDYDGWTLSEQDYDYVGGNLLEGTGTLTQGNGAGTLTTVNGTVTKNDFNGETSMLCKEMSALKGRVSSKTSLPSGASIGDKYAATDSWLVWKYTGTETTDDTHYNGWEVDTGEKLNNDIIIGSFSFTNGKDYILSWYAKGSGRMGAHISGDTQVVFMECADGNAGSATAYGEKEQTLNGQWKRYWMHVRPVSGTYTLLVIRQYRNDDNTASKCYITQVKLEEGATMTEWTERKTDLIDKASLKAAGINVTADMVELYGNQVKVSGAKGGTPIAMFEDGMLNANLINAGRIVAQQLQTAGENGQSVTVENGLMQIFGTNGICNIKFGVDNDGLAILSYYDKDGKWLYDLGPNKLDGSQLTESKLTVDDYVSATSFFGTNDFFTLETYIGITVKQATSLYSRRIFGNNMYAGEDQEVANNGSAHIGFQPFKSSSSVKLYRYTAPKQSNAIVKDEKYGLTTPDLAKAADGKYFTNGSTLASNGQLTNLAPAGYYFKKTAAVAMAPCPIPSDGSTAKFPAYSMDYLNISSDSIGSSQGGFNAIMSYLKRTVSQTT